MSVIVKNMEMPSGCQSCDFSDDETRFCKAAKEYIPMLGKPEFCPLVELPEKYGRLIDADALCDSLGVSDEDLDFKYMLEECQTVVEAEGE